MVAKEIEELLTQATYAKTAAYEAMIHASSANDAMCQAKMSDLESFSKGLEKKLSDLRNKIEYLKSHS